MKVATLLKQVSANVAESATEDQASDHSHQTNSRREEFDLEVTENPPTQDQLRTILEYVGQPAIPSVVKGANTPADALKKFKESADVFQRPVVRTCSPAPIRLPCLTRQSRSWIGTMGRPSLAATSLRY